MSRIGTNPNVSSDRFSGYMRVGIEESNPESEQADLSKTSFLPSVVVTDVREVDDTKENVDDEETRRIMSKYGGFVDEKRTMVDRRVDAMMAGKEAEEPLAELAESEEITITEEE